MNLEVVCGRRTKIKSSKFGEHYPATRQVILELWLKYNQKSTHRAIHLRRFIIIKIRSSDRIRVRDPYPNSTQNAAKSLTRNHVWSIAD